MQFADQLRYDQFDTNCVHSWWKLQVVTKLLSFLRKMRMRSAVLPDLLVHRYTLQPEQRRYWYSRVIELAANTCYHQKWTRTLYRLPVKESHPWRAPCVTLYGMLRLLLEGKFTYVNTFNSLKTSYNSTGTRFLGCNLEGTASYSVRTYALDTVDTIDVQYS